MDRVTLNRIATLIDEMLRHGVPIDVIQPVVDWLMEQTPAQLQRKKLT